MPYGVAVLDAGYRLDWCNDAAREQLGLDPVHDRDQPIVNMVRAPEFVGESPVSKRSRGLTR